MEAYIYSVLIVDDETYVVDWFSSLLEAQTEPELNVCRAYSATEALNWLNHTKIDIIITDIRMPKMSGIELAEKVRKNWPQCKVILLTAYEQFDYAYEAIKNNVFSYILKTEEDERILEEVNKAVKLLDKELNNLQLLDDVQERLMQSASIISKEILLKILKEEHTNVKKFFHQLNNIGFNIVPEEPFLLIIGRLEDSDEAMDVVERFRQFRSIEKIMEHYFDKQVRSYPVEYSLSRIAWLMQPENGERQAVEDILNSKQIMVFVKGMLETVQQSCIETLGITVSFALSEELLDAGELASEFLSLEHLLDLHGKDRAGFIISSAFFTNSSKQGELLTKDYTGIVTRPNITEKLKLYLNGNRCGEFMEELDKICEVLENRTSWNSNTAFEAYYSVAVALIAFINERRLAERLAFKIGLNELFHPQSSGSWGESADYLKRLSEIVFQLQMQDESEFSGNIIRYIKDYVVKNITQEISLLQLSEVTGYNSSYLSRIFKETTGETLNKYIGKQKMNKIKEIMSDDRFSISDVALKTGFSSRSYFNRFIKKATGMTPQELKEHVLHGYKI